jgi:tetratricopeptide (TPR) repeat protein
MLTEVIKSAHAAVKREDWNRAWQLCNEALNEDCDKAESLYLMGATMRAAGNLGLAYQVLRRALAQDQKQVNLWMTYAATLHDLNRYDEAREAMTVAHKLVPGDAMPLANIGATFVQQGRWREAIEWCDKSIKIDPNCHIARISRNFAYLSMGRWADGWNDGAWLYGNHLPLRVYNPKHLEEPMWDGTPGQVVVVQADQGLGDIIMYSQCLPEMARDCKEVILEVPDRMVGLMKRSFPMITVEGSLKEQTQTWSTPRIGTEHQIQAHVHISHLGKFYRNKDSDFPRKPYLVVDQERVEWWKERLAQYPKPWVGITYEGGIQATQMHTRSTPIDTLAPVLNSGGTMFDLSYRDNRMAVSRWNVRNPVQIVVQKLNANDYDATASFIAAMDDIVTVTTTVAHVCGALGKRAHVMVPSVPQWRYAYRCEDGMIWYPKDSVKLYRQIPGEPDFSATARRVARSLIESRK